MIDAVLGDRPHRARSVCTPGADGTPALLRLLGMLIAERVGVDLTPLYGAKPHAEVPSEERTIAIPIGGEPFVVPLASGGREPPDSMSYYRRHEESGGLRPPLASLLAESVATCEAHGHAHAAFLRYTDSVRQTVIDGLAFQTSLLESLQNGSPTTTVIEAPVLDRDQCLEFAVGSIGRVLGPDFAAVDAFPTRVRLPDEPLMLVDRITLLEGEPLSLTSGRVVTEHDVRHGAWYLDGGRMAACVAIESGQADLFLSAWLGIDFRTRGLAVYRLLDAKVTFYRGLPTPGQILRYDIHIERFFRQGDTHLFRFRFEGTADGEPLLTMTNGVAGFFTAEELASGKGVVQTELDRRPLPGVQPDDEAELPPRAVESYPRPQIDALRSATSPAALGRRSPG